MQVRSEEHPYIEEVSSAVLIRDSHGIVIMRIRDGSRMNGQNTHEVVRAHIRATGGERRPCLADIRGMRAADRAAREVTAGPELARVVSRLALLVGSSVTRVIASFFVRVMGPGYPTAVFSDETAARRWLLDGGAD